MRYPPTLFAALVLVMTGCSTPRRSTGTSPQKTAIETAFKARMKLEDSHFRILNGERIAALMAINVQHCPEDFRSAWFDYLAKAGLLHRRVERVAVIASIEGKPTTDLPSLIRFASTNPALGQYLLTALNEVDDAWSKVERIGMNYAVMPNANRSETPTTVEE